MRATLKTDPVVTRNRLYVLSHTDCTTPPLYTRPVIQVEMSCGAAGTVDTGNVLDAGIVTCCSGIVNHYLPNVGWGRMGYKIGVPEGTLDLDVTVTITSISTVCGGITSGTPAIRFAVGFSNGTINDPAAIIKNAVYVNAAVGTYTKHLHIDPTSWTIT